MNKEKAVKAAMLSKAIYRNDFADYEEEGRTIHHLENHVFGTAMFEINQSVVLFMVFRGSDDWQDWKQNFSCNLDNGVHAGFRNAVDACSPRILEIIERETFDQLVICGHSSGGAMAAILMQEILDAMLDIDTVCGFGFGMPRCFSDAAAASFNYRYKANFFHFHHNNDPVSNVPLLAQGYSHVGTYLHICWDGEIVQEISFWWEWIDRLAGAVEEWWTDEWENDHAIDAYEIAVKAAWGSLIV